MCPCTSPLHKGARAFVNVWSSFPCAFILRAHPWLYPFVHSARAVISKARRVAINEKHRPHKTGQRALAREIDLSSRKRWVLYIPSYSLVRDIRGPAQVTHARKTSRHREDCWQWCENHAEQTKSRRCNVHLTRIC